MDNNIHRKKNHNNRIGKSTDNIRFGKRVYEGEEENVVPEIRVIHKRESAAAQQKHVIGDNQRKRPKKKVQITEEQKSRKKKRHKRRLMI